MRCSTEVSAEFSGEIRVRRIRAACAAALAAALLASCARERAPVAVEIRWSADAHGELEACGCRTRPLGGIARRATVFGAPGKAIVRLDAGDFAGGQEDYEVLALDAMLAAVRAIGYDAVNLGRAEVAFGARGVRRFAEAAPIVSANVAYADGAAVAPPFRVLERGGARIAVIGLAARSDGEGLRVADPALALARHLPALAAEADARILLADVCLADAERIARKYPEIDLILLAGTGDPSRELRRVNRTSIAVLAGHGKIVAKTSFSVGPRGRIDGSEAHALVPLGPEIDADPRVAGIVRDFKDTIRAMRLAIDVPLPRAAGARYAGARACEPCHPRAYRVWEGSKHPRALEALEETGDDGDPRCLRCHVLGLGQEDGYRRRVPTPFRGVECESCHGRGSEHAEAHREGGSAPRLIRPTAADCERCHDGVQSDPFDMAKYGPPIDHREGA
ncbi:MAG: hypothetical protein JXP34_05955 [Planctomycetes bacterium]|nr:hypothetical protein [Planctomycetota bacterium]